MGHSRKIIFNYTVKLALQPLRVMRTCHLENTTYGQDILVTFLSALTADLKTSDVIKLVFWYVEKFLLNV